MKTGTIARFNLFFIAILLVVMLSHIAGHTKDSAATTIGTTEVDVPPQLAYKYGCPECRSVQWTSTRLIGVSMRCNTCFEEGRKLWTTVYLGEYYRQQEETP